MRLGRTHRDQCHDQRYRECHDQDQHRRNSIGPDRVVGGPLECAPAIGRQMADLPGAHATAPPSGIAQTPLRMLFARTQLTYLGLSTFKSAVWLRSGLLAIVLAAAGMANGQSDSNRISSSGDNTLDSSASTDASETRQLRQPLESAAQRQDTRTNRSSRGVDSDTRRESERTERTERTRPEPSEFEIYVNRLAFPTLEFRKGDLLPIRRLGSDLMDESARDRDAVDFSPLVPPDYVISPGDEIVLSIWGSVDAELRLFVDRSGRITVPRIGSMMVSGVRYADLPETIRLRVAQIFKNFQLSVSLGQLRGVRVFVTGFVARPGAYTVTALSGMANALVRAGGPSTSGSFRDIQLRRGNKTVSKLDFYDLLLNGNRHADQMVQADDVVHVGPIGPQVAVIGSVNRAAIFELKPGETMSRRAAHGRRLLGSRRHHAAGDGARGRARHRARRADRDGAVRQDRTAQRRRAAGLQRGDAGHLAAAPEQARACRGRGAAARRLPAAGAEHARRRAARRGRADAGRLRLRHRLHARERAPGAAGELRARTAQPGDRYRAGHLHAAHHQRRRGRRADRAQPPPPRG